MLRRGERSSLIIGCWDITVCRICVCAPEWGPHPCRHSPQTICPHIPSSETYTFGPRAHRQTSTIPSKSAFSAAEQANSAAINTKHTYLHRNKSPLVLPSTPTWKNKHLPNERYTKHTVHNDARAELRHTVLKHKAPSSTLHTLSEWNKQTYTSHIYRKKKNFKPPCQFTHTMAPTH